ncbi:MAG TPA: CBS domain-containing protein, partial [Chloroflexia bacterium]|nr:CBS domain-containing protein [Chloroflexia bacterium]
MKDHTDLVRAWMTTSVEVAHPDSPLTEAYNRMMQRGIRRLPVVDSGRLVGLVTLGDLREARPSSATSLSIYELNYLLAKLTIGVIMTHAPYTVTPDTPVAQAARLMLKHKIGGLPVVDESGTLLGIITESDIFRLLVGMWDAAEAPVTAPAAAGGPYSPAEYPPGAAHPSEVLVAA